MEREAVWKLDYKRMRKKEREENRSFRKRIKVTSSEIKEGIKLRFRKANGQGE